MDSGLDQNKSELGVLVLFVSLQVLSNLDSLLNQHVQILGDGGGEASLLQDSEDLGASNTLDLGDSVRISEDDADLYYY